MAATIQSLERGLTILTILSRSRHARSLNEISAEFEIDRSSVYRLLGTLVKHGYVIQNGETKKYSLGYRILELAGSIASTLNVEETLRPIMREVCEKTQQNTHCAVRDGEDVVFVGVEMPRDVVTVNISVGTREPAIATALGRAVLAYLPDPERTAFLQAAPFVAYTPASVRDAAALEPILEGVRAERLAVDDEEYREGIVCYAAPVFDHTGAVVCSLGISGHRATMKLHRDEYAAIVRTAGAEASRRFGWSG